MRCKKLRPFWFLSFVTVACCAIPATRASADSDLPEAPFSEIPLLPDHLRKPDEVAPGQKTISMAPPPNSVAPHDYYVSAKREPPKDIFGANSLLAAIDLGIRQNGGGFSYIMPQKDFYSYALTFDFESRLLDGLTYNTYGPGLFGELHYNFRNRVVPFIGVGLGFQHWHASGTANNQPEQVNGGTIFLDEIGDMSPATQAKALRLLQEQQFERIGGNATVKTDVRIIAATNRDLNQLVSEGRFRQDLLYRLNGFTIQLPPLRERLDDIPTLTEHFLKVYNRELNKNILSVSADVIDILQSHDWPGNVREFQSAIKYAMIHATGVALTPECLPSSCHPGLSVSIAANRTDSSARPTETTQAIEAAPEPNQFDLIRFVRQLLADEKPDLYRVIAQEVDRHVLQEIMSYFDGNQLHAAERLGISRMTLRSKLRSLGLI